MKVSIEFDDEQDGTKAPVYALSGYDYALAISEFQDWLESIVRGERAIPHDAATLMLIKDTFEQHFGDLPAFGDDE